MNYASGFYARRPLRVVDGISVFSTDDAYTANYERIAHDHLAHFALTGENPFIPEGLWRDIESVAVESLRRHATPGQRILDVGVGTGRLLAQFPELRRHGIDISMEYLREARAAGIDGCWALVEDMPYRDATFDLVVCTDVLEHVLDLHTAMTQMLRVLKPGGLLIVRTPYDDDLAGYLPGVCPYEYVHVRAFDENSLTLLLSRIFDCEVLGWARSGLVASPRYLRHRFDLVGVETLFARAVSATRLVSARLHRHLLARCFGGMTITMVARK